MFTYSKSLFHVKTKSSSTAEKRLVIDISASREAYEKVEISKIGLVKSENNPAEVFTKQTMNEIFRSIYKANQRRHSIEKWIVRDFDA